MPRQEKRALLHGRNGYVPNQPLFDDGMEGTFIGGENAIIEVDALRTFGGFLDMSEDRSDSNYGYTATTVANSYTVTLSAGATAKSDMRARQHLLIGGELFLVYAITDNTHIEVRPAPSSGTSGLAVRLCPTLTSVRTLRWSQQAGNAVYFDNAIFSVGAGVCRKNGALLSPSMTSSDALQVTYDDGTAPFPAGFSAYNGSLTIADGAAGSKNLTAIKYPFVIVRKRSGFGGQGNPCTRQYYTLLGAGNKIKITLPAFSGTEGENAWLIGVARVQDLKAGIDPSEAQLYFYPQEFTSSGDVQIEWVDEDLNEAVTYDNDPPPKALYAGAFGGHLMLVSTDGDAEYSSTSTTPGPFIAASKLSNPEAFAPQGRCRMPMGEMINGIHMSQYMCYVQTDNSLVSISLTGNEDTPYSAREEWHVGFLHQYQAILVGDRLVGFVGQSLHRTLGAGRDQVEMTDDFAIPVRPDLKPLVAARVFLGYDIQRQHLVLFHSCHEKRGGYWITKCWVWNAQLDKWSSPIILKATSADLIVTGVATVENILYFVTSAGKTYAWDRGTQTQAGYILFPFQSAGSTSQVISGRYTITGNLDGNPELYKNLKLDDAKAGTNPAARRTSAFASSGKVQSYPMWHPSVNAQCTALKLNFSALAAGDPILTEVIAEWIEYEGFRS